MSSAASDNPLLSLGAEIPFDRIRGEHVEPAVQTLLEDARARLDALGTFSGPLTYATVMDALEGITEQLDFVMGVVGHLESVATTPDAARRVQRRPAGGERALQQYRPLGRRVDERSRRSPRRARPRR